MVNYSSDVGIENGNGLRIEPKRDHQCLDDETEGKPCPKEQATEGLKDGKESEDSKEQPKKVSDEMCSEVSDMLRVFIPQVVKR